jgi:hypothetical protein
VFGPAVHQATAVLAGAPEFGASMCFATEAFARRMPATHAVVASPSLANLTTTEEHPSVPPSSSADVNQLSSAGLSTAIPPAHTGSFLVPIFGAPMRWRIRGVGTVSVHPVQQVDASYLAAWSASRHCVSECSAVHGNAAASAAAAPGATADTMEDATALPLEAIV